MNLQFFNSTEKDPPFGGCVLFLFKARTINYSTGSIKEIVKTSNSVKYVLANDASIWRHNDLYWAVLPDEFYLIEGK